MPKVSVILPAFNAERHLRQAIESILYQQFQDFEFLIVDDGSTDATRTIIRSYADARIRIIENSMNAGLPRSLNRALAVARGEYIARQDADDVSEPQRLAEQVAYLDRHPQVALLGSFFTVIDEMGIEVRRTSLPLNDLDLRWAMFFYCPFVHTAVMWRHDRVRQEIGAYDERFAYAQDHELWSRIASRFRIANLGEFLVRYREHSQSMTSSTGAWSEESLHLHVGAIGKALGWVDAALAERTERFRAMGAVLRESQLVDLTPQQVRRAVDDVLALQSVLCRDEGIESEAAGRHRRAVKESVSRGLVRISRRTAEQGRTADARRILSAAYRVYWPTLAHRSAARLAVRLGRPECLRPDRS